MSPLHALAMAVLVQNGIIPRSFALEALTTHHASRPRTPDPSDRREYAVAREIALRIDRGEIDYPDGERAMAIALARGDVGHFADRLPEAANLLGIAFGRLERLRQQVAAELDQQILSLSAPVGREMIDA